jgi:hypothetical protein
MIPKGIPNELFLKKLHTMNPKKKPKPVENNQSNGQGEIPMVDIDHILYTENSSNANSINKSEIIRQMVEKYDEIQTKSKKG